MQLKRYLVLVLVLMSTACASVAERVKEADITTYPDGAFTVTCVNGYCTSRERVHAHTKSCDHDD